MDIKYMTDDDLAKELDIRAEGRVRRGKPASIRTLSGFQKEAKRTTTVDETLPHRLEVNGLAALHGHPAAPQVMRHRDLDLAAMSLAGECGEVVDLLKKHVHFGKELDKNKLTEELGDLLWSIAHCATLEGITLDDVAEAASKKNRLRFASGFSMDAARKRADER